MSTANSSNDPLYIIDGVPTDNINCINPSDIETMQVLKDAASASIYGSRAANGVVVITTKQGKGDRMSININYAASAQTIAKRYDISTPSSGVSHTGLPRAIPTSHLRMCFTAQVKHRFCSHS